jgi:hypothetical protein
MGAAQRILSTGVYDEPPRAANAWLPNGRRPRTRCSAELVTGCYPPRSRRRGGTGTDPRPQRGPI